MNVRFTLTDSHFPPSEEFLEFLDTWLAGIEFNGSTWARYGQEQPKLIGSRLSPPSWHQRQLRIDNSDDGRRHLGRAYELFVALLIGDIDAIRTVQQQFRFLLVIGAPRSGGKYLTKELYRAIGYDPCVVPAVIAHDGFPEASPWRLDRSGTSWVRSLQTMAEYLTIVELFYSGANRHEGQIIVPKKTIKAAYAPGLFQSILGNGAEGFITVRHPVPACISTYKSAGGLPADQQFTQRGNIERLLARDLFSAGKSDREVAEMSYFDAYLRYWEDYHLRLAMSGSNITRHYRVVAYGAERFMREARRNAVRFGSPHTDVEQFHVDDRRDYHPEWNKRAEAALQRVGDQWARIGMAFPLDEIMEYW